ncbi:MurR/RpiR family transcriptional regulator [Brachybacterium sp. GPGPB12]|uniref:MurR/RpiR family transcriptional regulator n=1 Tax=Brachybacterium sp. GPGPB12 TaxID=3023517 RepID=UPI00313443E9
MNAAIRVLPSAGLREMPRREVRIDARIDAKYAELTPQERRICDFLLEHLGDLAVFSAADISRETGVSKATVSRLFRKLDFADFREVKEHTRAMRRAGTPLAAPTRTGVPGLRPSLEAHVRAERENHDRPLTVLSGGALEEATALLTGARRILVVGLRNSYPVALHLHQRLIQARDEVRLAPQPGQAVWGGARRAHRRGRGGADRLPPSADDLPRPRRRDRASARAPPAGRGRHRPPLRRRGRLLARVPHRLRRRLRQLLHRHGAGVPARQRRAEPARRRRGAPHQPDHRRLRPPRRARGQLSPALTAHSLTAHRTERTAQHTQHIDPAQQKGRARRLAPSSVPPGQIRSGFSA